MGHWQRQSKDPNEQVKNFFLQLTEGDTLAGLAIKYDTTVEDLKRANGLVSDWDLWKKSGLAPTGTTTELLSI